ncbi:acyltransferase domain-containing protein [Streptomyces sp. NPDC055287]
MLQTLRADQKLGAWLKELEELEEPEELDRLGFGPVALPGADELPDVLLDLAVPHEDINPLVALRDTLVGDAEWHWLLRRSVVGLLRDMGVEGGGLELPLMPAELGEPGRLFPVYVFVAALPYVEAYHREHAVPHEISRRTLADLGRNMALHRRRLGTGGLLVPFWIRLHFRGEIYQLGRLQFQRTRVGAHLAERAAAAGVPVEVGDPALNLHIPDCRGPMTPSACDASLALAREFFARHCPQEDFRVGVCRSWLLDPQLRAYLREDSSIVRFQDRFRPLDPVTAADDTLPVGFVFGDPDLPVDQLPRRTAVERAIGDHLRAGGHWYGGKGWLRL